MHKMLIMCKRQLIKFYAILFDNCSLQMTPCGLQHVAVLTVTIYYKYLRKSIVLFFWLRVVNRLPTMRGTNYKNSVFIISLTHTYLE
jgi:hypothetical protein